MVNMNEFPPHVYIAILSMMFGATAAANASMFGPDIGKASNAAGKIFSVIDEPSQIDPM